MRFVDAAVWGIVCVAAASMLAGCDHDQCSNGETKCASSTAMATCGEVNNGGLLPLGSSLQWEPATACPTGGHCIQAGAQTFCSPVTAPVPECDADGGPGGASALPLEVCWNNTPVGCTAGFPVLPSGGVAPCPVGATCATDEAQTCAYCLSPNVVAASDPVCSQGRPSTCFDNAVYGCVCEVRIDKETDCGDAAVCVVEPSGIDSFCALSGAPDPQCASVPAYCAQGAYVQCKDGYAITTARCQQCAPAICLEFADAGAD